MTVSFIDGPAAGQTLLLRRAPPYLRVVHDPAAPAHNERVRYKRDRKPEWDALDQIADEARPGETVHVYRRCGEASLVFIRPGGRYVIAEYRHVPDADVEGDGLMHNFFWQLWAQRQAERETTVPTGERTDERTGGGGPRPAA